MRSGLDEDYLFVFAAPVDSVEEEEVSADVAFAVIGQVHGERERLLLAGFFEVMEDFVG